MSGSHYAASLQLLERNVSTSSSWASMARYPGRSPLAAVRSGSSSLSTALNTLRTAAAGPTVWSMWDPAAARGSGAWPRSRQRVRPLHTGTQRLVIIILRVRATLALVPITQPAHGVVGDEGAVVGPAVEWR
jgi:hypothetical protein